MLIGEYQHNIDEKGRVFIPARFREALGLRFILTKGLDNCLYVYSLEEWKALEEKIRSRPMAKSRNLQRFLFAGAVDVEADKQGRVVVPPHLRAYAALTREAVIIGASNHAEIWDAAAWRKICGEIDSDTIAAEMDELGF